MKKLSLFVFVMFYLWQLFAQSSNNILFFDDFSVDNGWVLQGNWQRGQAIYEPPDDYSGDGFIIANPLGTDYSNNMGREFVLSPIINCQDVDTRVFISFFSFSGCEQDGIDYMGIEVFDGSQWNLVWHNQAAFQETNWTYYEFDVTPWAQANPDFRVRFYLGPTDVSITYSGWAIDDFKVFSTPKYDLAVDAIAPKIVFVDSLFFPNIKISNRGYVTEKNFLLNITISDVDTVQVIIDSLVAGADTILSCEEGYILPENDYLIKASVSSDSDTIFFNNFLVDSVFVRNFNYRSGQLYVYDAYDPTGENTNKTGTLFLPAGSLKHLQNPEIQTFFSCGEYIDGIIYAIQYATHNIFVLFPDGSALKIGELKDLNSAASINGIAYDEVNRKMYIVTREAGKSYLYYVNEFWECSEIGSIGRDLCIGLASDSSGNLYGIGMYADNFFKIDKETCFTTGLFDFDFDIHYAQDIGGNRENNTIYAVLYDRGINKTRFGFFDLQTGSFNEIKQFPYEFSMCAVIPTDFFSVRFNILADGFGVDSAKVKLFQYGEDLAEVLSASGIAEFKNQLCYGAYSYEISLNLYDTVRGVFTIENHDTIINVEMQHTSLEENNFLESNCNFYPNPVVEKLNIDLSDKYRKKNHIVIFDDNGKQILDKFFYGTRIVVNFSDKPQGIYYIFLDNLKGTKDYFTVIKSSS